ncbi:50S ribosomal protein L15e [archaeon]|nr:50S ribosomal protein L15e [archaeon]
MGIYKYVRKLWKQPKSNLGELWQERLILWRKEPVTVRIEKPTRIDRARSLGYKAKEGYIIVRARVKRGGRKRERRNTGRRSKTMTSKKVVGKSYRWVAEERVNRKYINCEVLGSYEVGKDGKSYWFEVILGDRSKLSKYPETTWIGLNKNKGKVWRGRTSAGRKSRGLRGNKGKGAEKIRPSLRSHKRRSK